MLTFVVLWYIILHMGFLLPALQHTTIVLFEMPMCFPPLIPLHIKINYLRNFEYVISLQEIA